MVHLSPQGESNWIPRYKAVPNGYVAVQFLWSIVNIASSFHPITKTFIAKSIIGPSNSSVFHFDPLLKKLSLYAVCWNKAVF